MVGLSRQVGPLITQASRATSSKKNRASSRSPFPYESGPLASGAATVSIGFLEGGTVARADDPSANQQSHSHQGASNVFSPQPAIQVPPFLIQQCICCCRVLMPLDVRAVGPGSIPTYRFGIESGGSGATSRSTPGQRLGSRLTPHQSVLGQR